MQRFLWGFTKGVFLILGLVVLQLVFISFIPNIKNTFSFTFILWLISVSIPWFLVRKHNLPKSLYLVSFIFGVFIVPFILGSVEKQR